MNLLLIFELGNQRTRKALIPCVLYTNAQDNVHFFRSIEFFLFSSKVSQDSNTTHLKCLCNHLTSFGGNFIQAPNPIDFDKVFTEFSNLAESGNISVLVTIACFFLLYFVVLILARRADKRDVDKVIISQPADVYFELFSPLNTSFFFSDLLS